MRYSDNHPRNAKQTRFVQDKRKTNHPSCKTNANHFGFVQNKREPFWFRAKQTQNKTARMEDKMQDLVEITLRTASHRGIVPLVP
jgi:hypothetical protein